MESKTFLIDNILKTNLIFIKYFKQILLLYHLPVLGITMVSNNENHSPFNDDTIFRFFYCREARVDIVKYNILQLHIDHLKGIVQFGSEVKILVF